MKHSDSLGPRLELNPDGEAERCIPIVGNGILLGRDSTASVRFEDPHISRGLNGSRNRLVSCSTARPENSNTTAARLVGQSNGGLIGYAWAFRQPDCVDRIFGICPVTDFRTWPTLPVVVTAPAPGLGYDLSLEELTRRIGEFNPIDNLAPLARARVKILHIHGDQDKLVPLEPNSAVLIKRYKAAGGAAELVTLKGMGHGGTEFYESRPGIEFLLGD